LDGTREPGCAWDSNYTVLFLLSVSIPVSLFGLIIVGLF
jgi:hypothetical protein